MRADLRYALPPSPRHARTTSCGRNILDQPRVDARCQPFFADGSAMRPIPEGTVSRERGALQPSYLTGLGPTGFLAELPIELTTDVLLRGQERSTSTAPRATTIGDGTGIIVQRGFRSRLRSPRSSACRLAGGLLLQRHHQRVRPQYSYARASSRRTLGFAATSRRCSSARTSISDVPSDILSSWQHGGSTVNALETSL